MKVNKRVIRIRMAELEMKTNDLASLSRLSRQSIYNVLNGISEPKPDTVGKLAKALNCNVRDIFDAEN